MLQTSFPKEKIHILLLENISNTAIELLKKQGYTNIKTHKGALLDAELIKALKNVHILGIRSKTEVTKEVLEAAPKLLSIGCFCIGTNQVNLQAAASSGIAVFNAPYSNTRSVAEIVMANAISLIRQIPEKNKKAHEGIWWKESKNSYEIRGKKLGIVGYGHIGSQVSILAESWGMEVLYYDIVPKLPLGNAKLADSLEDLVSQCDVITIHVPGLKSTKNLFNKKLLAACKPNSVLINYSRGEVVDLDALKILLEKKHFLGAAIDVFPEEPQQNGEAFFTPLQNIENVILTPHIGGSTEEAQENIGLDVASKLTSYIDTGNTFGSHSIPELNLLIQQGARRILHIHQNIPGVLSELNGKMFEQGLNIVGQYLNTKDQVGYVVLDIQDNADKIDLAFEAIKKVRGTIKARILY